MKLHIVTVSETGVSELLPLHPETVRVFLILKEPRADGTFRPSFGSPSLPAPTAPAVRRSFAHVWNPSP